MATVLFFVGRFFIKSRNTERSVLFLSGDYTGLNTEKICRVTGKRIKTWAMLFCLGGIIDFIKPGAGIIIAFVFFIILLVFHLVDMTINRPRDDSCPYLICSNSIFCDCFQIVKAHKQQKTSFF